jgi:hypothetical protein
MAFMALLREHREGAPYQRTSGKKTFLLSQSIYSRLAGYE